MGATDNEQGPNRLFFTLQQLLMINATELGSALDQVSDLLVVAFDADKVDAFLYDPATTSLVAAGTSHTPLGRHQQAVGLDRMPVANGGRSVQVFETGLSYHTGRADEDPEVLPGIRKTLAIRSMLIAPLVVGEERRGVLSVTSMQPEMYDEEDLRFLEAVAQWVGVVVHRAELVEHIAHETAARTRQVVAEELIAVLAHDLSNYLLPLTARIELIHQRAQREGRERDLRDANEARLAARRFQSLVRDLLDVARLEQGVFALVPEWTDLVTLVQGSAEMMQTTTHPIQVRTPPDLYVEMDPERIRQALDNLLSNALKHSPSGVPIVVELTREERQGGPWAVLRVRDEGPGIAPELLPRLFSRFTPGAESIGLGLGLYIAHSIVHAHGGSLTVSSTPNAGTSFYLALPIHEA